MTSLPKRKPFRKFSEKNGQAQRGREQGTSEALGDRVQSLVLLLVVSLQARGVGLKSRP